MRHGIYKTVVSATLCLGASSAFAEEPDAARLESVRAAYESAIKASGDEQLGLFRDTRDRLDGIIDDYPASDAAVGILLRREILGLDLSVIDTAFIAALGDRAPVFVAPGAFSGVLGPAFAIEGAAPVTDEGTDGPTFAPEIESGSFESPDGYVWVQIASRDNLTEAQAVANAFDSGDPGSINIFRSENGWYAITGPLVPVANVDSVIEANGYPADSLSTRGSRYIQRIVFRSNETGTDLSFPIVSLNPDALSGVTQEVSQRLLDTPIESRVWELSDATSEELLELSRPDIAEMQARLFVLGYDPNGIDGLIGRGTRAAISNWQRASGIAASGYLDALQLTYLKDLSEDSFAAWKSVSENRAVLNQAGQAPQPVTRSQPATRAAPRSQDSVWFRDNRGMYCKYVWGGLRFCQPSAP